MMLHLNTFEIHPSYVRIYVNLSYDKGHQLTPKHANANALSQRI